MPVRLAVLDDNPYVRTYAGETRPVSSTFNTFVEAVARSGSICSVSYVVPVRHLRIWEVEPALEPVDESHLDIVPTASFGGIADYLLRAGWVAGRSWRPIEQAVASCDLLWLRLPASNALLALAAARRCRKPVFSWVAGSAAAVAGSQRRVFPLGLIGQMTGRAYDAVAALAAGAGPVAELDDRLFASTLTDDELAATRDWLADPQGREHAGWRIAWAGRMGGEKGLPELVEAVRLLHDAGRDVRLVLIGDGPQRRSVERALRRLPQERVEDYGFVGHRPFYLNLLRGADVLIHPSRAEGVPKVLLDAMAAGLPIVATDVGAVRPLLGNGERGVVVPDSDPRQLADAVGALLDDPERRQALRARALDWVADHTAGMQANRLIDRLRSEFPRLSWEGTSG